MTDTTTDTDAALTVWIADGTPIRDQWTWAGTADSEADALDLIRRCAIDALAAEMVELHALMHGPEAVDSEDEELFNGFGGSILPGLVRDAEDVSLHEVREMDPTGAEQWAAELIDAGGMCDELDAETVDAGDPVTVGVVCLDREWTAVVERDC